MKIWQLMVCLEDKIFKEYFGDIDATANGRNTVANDILVAALSKSAKKYYRDNINFLRLYDEKGNNKYPIVEIFSIIQAYSNFGADAITEVIDYGCYELPITS